MAGGANSRRVPDLDISGRAPAGQLGHVQIGSDTFPLAYAGPWIATDPVIGGAVFYHAGQVVTSGGSQYLCIATNTNDEPPSANWELWEREKYVLNSDRLWAKVAASTLSSGGFSTYQDLIVSLSAYAFWPMSDISGGAVDVIGGHNLAENPTGSSVGQPVSTQGTYAFTYGEPGPFTGLPAATSILFDGDDAGFLSHGTILYANLPGGNPLLGSHTLVGWVYPTDYSGAGHSIFSKPNAPSGQESVYFDFSTDLHFDSNLGDITVPAPFPINGWHCIAITYDGSSVMQIAVDGVVVGTTTGSPVSSSQIRFGAQGTGASGPTNFFKGRLHGWALFYGVLDDPTLAALAGTSSSTSGGGGDSLEGLVPITDGLGGVSLGYPIKVDYGSVARFDEIILGPGIVGTDNGDHTITFDVSVAASGATWYVGSGAPSTLHNDGDFYLRSDTGEVYEQVSGAWSDQGFTLKGADGSNGSVWYTGSSAPSTLHNDGDFYLRTTNGEVYQQVSGAWVDQSFTLKGADGSNGTNGAVWYTGSGAPSTLHNDGDFYLRTSNGEVYKQVSGAWVDQSFSLQGSAGVVGSAWYTGSAAPSTLHNDGDFYLRTSNGEVYKQVAGAWVDQSFSLIGPTGTGAQIYTGSGAPSGGLGVDGDIYLRYTGAIYKKVTGSWVDQGAPTKQIVVAWSGTMPTTTGAGIVWKVPKVGGVSATFLLSYAISRVETTPTGSNVQFVLEKSAGGGAFSGSPTTISTLTTAPADYEHEDTGVSLSVSSGDLLRLSFTALGGLAGACGYSIELQGVQSA